MENGVFTIRLEATLVAGNVMPRHGEARRKSVEFIAGPENRLASVAVDSLSNDVSSPFSPLVIYGPTGTGKTHLAHGLAQAWNARRGGGALYITASDFAHDLTAAIEAETTAEVRGDARSRCGPWSSTT